MKIGIFDSGLGGLIVARAIRRAMPEYDYVYLGDTKRVPYGPRSHEAVYDFTKQAVEHLFEKKKCALVVVACNTSSARALARVQKDFVKKYPNKKILGVLVPTAEEGAKYDKCGVIATRGTVSSLAFEKEIRKINKRTEVFQNAAPMLVPLAEEGEKIYVREFLKKYLEPLVKKKVKALILGCTHYPIYKKEIAKLLPKNIKIISQDEIIPEKLRKYLQKHPELTQKLSKNKSAEILVTDRTHTIDKLAENWFGKGVKPKLITINHYV